jgi:cyclohexa-1,5-dienecarbonyl-CoA hydratase
LLFSGAAAILRMTVRVQKKERAAIITLDRPPLNVLDLNLLRDLREVLISCAADSTLDVVVLEGAGESAFSAGVDVRDHTRDKVPEMLETVHGVIRQILSLPQVTVARIHGVCFGGGLELASCCDLLLASEESSFATPEVHVGCFPPVALARFPLLIGYHRAAEMILTGRRFSAQEALAAGLVNRVLPNNLLQTGLESLLDEILGKSGAVLRITLKGLRELSLEKFSDALKRSEEIYCRELLQTEDVEEGVQAFLAKRKPAWRHR